MDIKIAIIIYIAMVSGITFLCFGIDKWKAKNQRWRIKEATLIGLCICRQAVGGNS